MVEEVLRDGAAELSSVTLLEGWRVTGVVDGTTSARATLLAPDGTEHAEWSRWSAETGMSSLRTCVSPEVS